jgi:hypothetical protein
LDKKIHTLSSVYFLSLEIKMTTLFILHLFNNLNFLTRNDVADLYIF